jgi:hypothetical protein
LEITFAPIVFNFRAAGCVLWRRGKLVPGNGGSSASTGRLMVADSTGGTVGLQDKTTSGLKAVSRMPPDY